MMSRFQPIPQYKPGHFPQAGEGLFKPAAVLALAPSSYLEVGSRDGGQLVLPLINGIPVCGLDLDLDALGLAAKKGIPGVLGDAHQLPFEANQFEAVGLWDVLEHVQNDGQVLNEALRVSARHLLLSVPRQDELSTPGSGLLYRHYLDPTHRRYYTWASLQALLNRCNVKETWVSACYPFCPIDPVSLLEIAGIPRLIATLLRWRVQAWGAKDERYYRNLFIWIDKKGRP